MLRGGNIMSEITIVDIKPQIVLGIRKRGQYSLIAELLLQIFKYAMENGAQIQGHPIFICHEKSTEAVKTANAQGNADVEVAVPVAGEIKSAGEIKKYELAGGKMAKIIHKGPYEACEATYEKLMIWLQKHGKTLVGPTREVYLNDPREVGMEEALTEIYAPIG